MKLDKLYKETDKKVFLEYMSKLQDYVLKSGAGVLNEAKITITIDDDEKNRGIPEDTKVKFIDGAKELGNFKDNQWVEQMLKGMEQAGVQGARARFNEIKEDDGPVSRSEVKQLLGLLINLISCT
tara:strand:+ start:30964 stop:31338 length:375 start_codon:yes stop_codon:yes gene_type:complete